MPKKAKGSTVQDSAVELRDIAQRISEACDELFGTGLKKDLLIHAIYMAVNRGLPARDKVGKRHIERILDSLDNVEALLFEEVGE